MLEKIHELREVFYYLSPFDQQMVIWYAYRKYAKRWVTKKVRTVFANIPHFVVIPNGQSFKIILERRHHRRIHLVHDRRITEILRRDLNLYIYRDDDNSPTQP